MTKIDGEEHAHGDMVAVIRRAIYRGKPSNDEMARAAAILERLDDDDRQRMTWLLIRSLEEGALTTQAEPPNAEVSDATDLATPGSATDDATATAAMATAAATTLPRHTSDDGASTTDEEAAPIDQRAADPEPAILRDGAADLVGGGTNAPEVPADDTTFYGPQFKDAVSADAAPDDEPSRAHAAKPIDAPVTDAVEPTPAVADASAATDEARAEPAVSSPPVGTSDASPVEPDAGGSADPIDADVHRYATPAHAGDPPFAHAPQARPPVAAPQPPRRERGRLDRAARVGAPFEGRLVNPEGFVASAAVGLECTGLAFDAEQGIVTGTPVAPGTYAAKLVGQLDGQEAVVELEVYVNPDPSTLWKDIPSDQRQAFPKPDMVCRAIEGELTLLMASRRGRKHANTGSFRDDDAGIAFDRETGWHIGVVADGAGSARYSREGSRIAVESVLDDLPRLFREKLPPDILDIESEEQLLRLFYQVLLNAASNAAVQINAKAREHELDPDALSTTLIVGVAKRRPGGWLCATFAVGDGLAALWTPEDGGLRVMMEGDHGEFAGQTLFLRRSVFRDQNANVRRLAVSRPERFGAFCLMTDGITDAWFPTDSTCRDPAVWRDVWEKEIGPALGDAPHGEPAAEQLLDWLNFFVKGEHDDRSIVLMLPRPDGVEA